MSGVLKFRVRPEEFRINRAKAIKMVEVGVFSVFGWVAYTETGISDVVNEFITSLPWLDGLLQNELVKVFVIAIIIWYVKDVLD